MWTMFHVFFHVFLSSTILRKIQCCPTPILSPVAAFVSKHRVSAKVSQTREEGEIDSSIKASGLSVCALGILIAWHYWPYLLSWNFTLDFSNTMRFWLFSPISAPALLVSFPFLWLFISYAFLWTLDILIKICTTHAVFSPRLLSFIYSCLLKVKMLYTISVTPTSKGLWDWDLKLLNLVSTNSYSWWLVFLRARGSLILRFYFIDLYLWKKLGSNLELLFSRKDLHFLLPEPKNTINLGPFEHFQAAGSPWVSQVQQIYPALVKI